MSSTPRGAGDDLGRERGAAHAAEHDVRDAVGLELLAQGLDLGHQRAGDGDGLGPAEALRRLGLGRGAPELGVLRGDAAGDEVGDEAGDGAADRVGGRAADGDAEAHRAASSAVRTVSSSSCQETMNFSTPSRSSTAVTSS